MWWFIKSIHDAVIRLHVALVCAQPTRARRLENVTPTPAARVHDDDDRDDDDDEDGASLARARCGVKNTRVRPCARSRVSAAHVHPRTRV